jgi:hypothetical protein
MLLLLFSDRISLIVARCSSYGRGDPLRWPRDTLYPQKLALTSPTCGCRSVGIVRLQTIATEFSLVCVHWYTSKYNSASCMLHAGLLLGLFSDTKYGSDMLLWNAGFLTQDYVELHPRIFQSPLWKPEIEHENDYFCVGYSDSRGDVCIKRLLQVTNIKYITDSLTRCS